MSVNFTVGRYFRRAIYPAVAITPIDSAASSDDRREPRVYSVTH